MLLYQSCFSKISIIFPPSNLTFRMTVLTQKFHFFWLLLNFFALYMQLQHWWCVPADIWKYLTCSSLLLFLIFVPFPKSQPDWRGCGSLSCTCAVLLWELPPVFSLGVCWSLCQTSVIPQTLVTRALRGDTPPLFTQHVQTEASTPAWAARCSPLRMPNPASSNSCWRAAPAPVRCLRFSSCAPSEQAVN